MLIPWLSASAREPCPAVEAPATPRSVVLQAAQRAFEGYRARDVRIVDAARCDVEGGLRSLRETLGPADAARVHLAYAVAAQITGEPPETVRDYLASARSADSYLDESVEVLVGEGDPLVDLYRTAGGSGDPGSAARLAPAWQRQVLVDGVPDSRARPGPYVLQLAGRDERLDRSWYVESGGAPPRYVRKRPVIAGLTAGTALAAGAGLGLASMYASRGARFQVSESEALAAGARVSGAQLEALQEEVDGYRLRNNVALGAAAGLGLVTAGLGVWYVTTF
jgi:hypothetical protein